MEDDAPSQNELALKDCILDIGRHQMCFAMPCNRMTFEDVAGSLSLLFYLHHVLAALDWCFGDPDPWFL